MSTSLLEDQGKRILLEAALCMSFSSHAQLFFFFLAPTTCSLAIRQKKNKHSNLELPNFYILGSKLQ